jgi:hypothetical protein
MTIATTIDDLLHHPYWKNEDERRIYLIDFATHIYEQTCYECAVVYRNNRRYTPTECFEAIKLMPPPALNFWMKRAEPTCVVVPLMHLTTQPTKKAGKFFNPFQLIIEFPQVTSIAVLQA